MAKNKLNPLALVNKLFLHLSEREKDILRRRFRLRGESRKESLGSIGESLGLTRERIRQIGSQAVRNIRKVPAFKKSVTPIRKVIAKVINHYGGVMEKDYCLDKVMVALGKKNLKEKEREIQQAHIFFIISILDEAFEETKILDTNSAWKLKGISLDFPCQILKDVIRIFKTKKYPLKLRELIELLKKHPYSHRGKSVSREIVRGIIEWSKLVDENPYEEWGLITWREIWPKKVGDKAYLVLKKTGKPLHFSEIARLINEREFDKRPAHVPAVHNELITNNNFVLIGRGLYALREWGYRSGTVKDIASWVLEEKGPLTRPKLVKEVLRQRMVRSTTVNLALTDEKKFKKLSNGRYILANRH